MKTPFELLQDRVLVPVYKFKNKYISRDMLHKVCKNTANFIYDKSKETAIILLSLNAISTISSHISQIRGLKKNKRENSDYLINQEWQELGLDLIATIIPPFMLNNFLMKKLDSGKWTTKSARDNLINVIAPTVGATQNDLYNTQHLVPVKETLGGIIAHGIEKVRNGKKPHPKLEKLFSTLEQKSHYIRIPDQNKAIPLASMEQITTDFDVIRHKAFKKFYHGSAYDEISGQRNGILILAAIAYTVLASCIITPIIKNKLANRSYNNYMKKKELKAKKAPINDIIKPMDWYENTDNSSIFNTFSPLSTVNYSKNTEKENLLFNRFNKISSSSNLRI